MNRLGTFVEADAGRFTRYMTGQRIDSEWVLGHHLQKNNISVSYGTTKRVFAVMFGVR